MIDALLALVALVVGVLRLLITPRLDLPTTEGCYEAFAHIFVGGLFGAWLVRRPAKSLWLVLALCISTVELTAFLVQKFM